MTVFERTNGVVTVGYIAVAILFDAFQAHSTGAIHTLYGALLRLGLGDDDLER